MLGHLKPRVGSTKNRKRIGRGIGSGTGKTAGKGHKGQKCRSGGFTKVGFEGGQMPLQRRLPKRGFFNKFAVSSAEVTTRMLEKFDDGSDVDLAALKKIGLIQNYTQKAKVIVKGDLTRKINLKGIRTSSGAAEVIKKAGGTVA